MENYKSEHSESKKMGGLAKRNRQKLTFYWLMFAPLLLQFLIFYVYINFQSFALAFQKFDYDKGAFVANGFRNFTAIFKKFGEDGGSFQSSIVNSLELFFWTLVFGSALAIFFSYYIYKKHPGAGIFKIVLYTPHIVSSVVFVIMYMYFVDRAVPAFYEKITGEYIMGLLDNQATERGMIMFFNIWISFGTQVLMYTGAMSGISDSIIESGELDGITPLKELIFIVLPSIWQTFITFMVVSVVNLFTNQMSLYAFYGTHAEKNLHTFGYYLYIEVLQAQNPQYPELSALGLLLTAVAVPLTLGVRWALNKFGPKTV